MLSPESGCKIYLCTGQTDMRKGVNGLSILAQSVISDNLTTGALFVFRGTSADKILGSLYEAANLTSHSHDMDSTSVNFQLSNI